MTVADKIGDEYKKWENYNKVFISAPTGTGKTYFVLNVLLPYACSQNKRILFLVNRKILKEQMKADILELTDDSYKNIEVETYQALERRISEIRVDNHGNRLLARGYDALKRYEGYDYVVCDECHYFLADSNYNTNTEKAFRWVQEKFISKIRIFMSATIDDVKTYIEKDDWDSGNVRTELYHVKCRTISNMYLIPQRKCVYEYYMKRDYSYVDVHIIEKRDDVADIVLSNSGKWMIFVDSISFGRELEKNLKTALKEEGRDKSVVMITSDYRREEESAEEVAEITRKNHFAANILITTSVLDNGINIKDLELRNIVLFADAEVEFVQMLGRKRKDGNKTNLYIYKMSKQHFQNRLDATRKAWEIANRYRKNFLAIEDSAQKHVLDINWLDNKEKEEIFIQHCKIMNKLANNDLEYADIRQVFYVDGGRLVLSLLAYEHLKRLRTIYSNMRDAFEEIGEDAFLKEQLRWLGKSDIEADELIANSKISQLDKDREKVIETMEQMIDKPMDKKTMGEFKVTIKTELINLLKGTVCTEDDKEALIKDLGKKDRPLSGPQFEILNKHYGIPYGLEVEGGKYTIKKV